MSDYASSQPVRTESAGDVAVKIVDKTITSQALAIDSNGLVGAKVSDGVGIGLTSQTSGAQQALDVGVNVAGVQIDPRQVRALTSSDVVTSDQGAPNTAANGWPVKPTDGTNSQGYTALSEAKVSVTQPLPAGTNLIGSVDIKDSSGGSITVGQKAMSASVPVVISSDQSAIPVTITSSLSGTEINDYNTASAIAANASSNHDYAITSGKTFKGKLFWASSSGKLKVEIQISPDGSSFATKWVGFNSTSSPNISIPLDLLTISESGAGSKIRIIRTNLDKAAEDVYSTISGNEI